MTQKVYLMKNDFGLYKIGISNNPSKRARVIANNSGVPTYIINVWQSNNAARTEKRLHKKFESVRMKGEWFNFTHEDISNIIENFEYIDSYVEVIKSTPKEKVTTKETSPSNFSSTVIERLEMIASDVDMVIRCTPHYWDAIKFCLSNGVDVNWLIKYGFLDKSNKQKAMCI